MVGTFARYLESERNMNQEHTVGVCRQPLLSDSIGIKLAGFYRLCVLCDLYAYAK